MKLIDRLSRIASRLIDQRHARIIIPPQSPAPGHWFGGGNMVEDADGVFWLVGRYRNQGDSRTGLDAGQRGLELAIFRSDDRGKNFTKTIRFSKSELDVGSHQVLSIEGSALRISDDGVELYVSTEKSGIEYPDGLGEYLKPGTGVWTIDRLRADSMDALATARAETILASQDPQCVHVKDPFLGTNQGRLCLLFCSHPYCWTSSNAGYVQLDSELDSVPKPNFNFFPRGFTWDVAITRGTAVLPLPRVGVLADHPVSLMFYDGGECVRNLDEHSAAVKRPRGYSCEELGGVAYYEHDDLDAIERLSVTQPMFVSPHGTGCSRYVDVLATTDHYYATWQQAQQDGSQPLVMNVVPRAEIEALLVSHNN